jgi:hypothetical protein
MNSKNIKKMPLQTSQPRGPMRTFPPRSDYTSLSIKDLLEARDAHQVYLSTLENVVATAIGRYLIHEEDWYAVHPPDQPRPKDVPLVSKPRTLTNSIVRPWSWPAVLVFVRNWESMPDIGNQAVPRSLYLPDGRVVPTCVVEATPDEEPPLPPPGAFHNSELVGGGYSCMRERQGEQGFGTLACLTRKGGTYYALTNRHVAGGEGEAVKALIRGKYTQVGITSNLAVERLSMAAAFPQWSHNRLSLTLDAGLVRIEDINDWTSQAFGIGELGEVFNATEQSVTLDLIGCPVRAFGGVSGVSEGEIRALFYRYQSLGGQEYATDVLIAPRKVDKKVLLDRPLTRAGDSGTLWFYDPPSVTSEDKTNPDFDYGDHQSERGLRARRLRPVAMQWGGQRLVMPDGRRTAFALATFLSTICRALDVEVVRDWSLGHDEYWGKIGHFSIGWKACELVDGSLGLLMQRNQRRIGFGNDTLSQGAAFRMGRQAFVPLADVPDYVWVPAKGSRPSEGAQHFADVDIYDIDGGKTLLQKCIDDKSNVSAKVWKAYFDGFASEDVGPDVGCLPFRVWQIWDAMVDYLKKGDILRFLCAAGILSHYVGDASQPLHCSYLHHGQPPTKKANGRDYPYRHDSEEYKEFQKSRAYKVHSIYEEMMLEVDPATALAEVDKELKNGAAKRSGARAAKKRPAVSSGHEAAVATVQLMYGAQKRLAPTRIVEADDPELGPKARASALWEQEDIRNGTIASLADSSRLLADLWTDAWKRGGGDRIAKAKLVEFEEPDLEAIYRRDRKFLPSLSLAEMVKSGKFEP